MPKSIDNVEGKTINDIISKNIPITLTLKPYGNHTAVFLCTLKETKIKQYFCICPICKSSCFSRFDFIQIESNIIYCRNDHKTYIYNLQIGRFNKDITN